MEGWMRARRVETKMPLESRYPLMLQLLTTFYCPLGSAFHENRTKIEKKNGNQFLKKSINIAFDAQQ